MFKLSIFQNFTTDIAAELVKFARNETCPMSFVHKNKYDTL